VVLLDVRHTALESQHPMGHDVASHTQAPFTQRCPAAHSGPPPHVELHAPPMHCWPLGHCALEPHWHAPLAQRSARVASQLVHTPPLKPQEARVVAVTHALPLQQPAHVVASQVLTPESAPPSTPPSTSGEPASGGGM
jgi:hypothetical protein